MPTTKPQEAEPITHKVKDNPKCELVWVGPQWTADGVGAYYRRTCNVYAGPAMGDNSCTHPIGHSGPHLFDVTLKWAGPKHHELVWSMSVGKFYRRCCNQTSHGSETTPTVYFDVMCTLPEGHEGPHSATDLAVRPTWENKK